MHPLETRGQKEKDWPLERIENVTDTVWISIDRWNDLPNKRRHTAEDGSRFAYLDNFGGWKRVKIV